MINLEEVHYLYKVCHMFSDVELKTQTIIKMQELTGELMVDELYSALYRHGIFEISKDCISKIRTFTELFDEAEMDIFNFNGEYLLIEMYKNQEVVDIKSREFLGSRKFKLV